MTYLFVGQFSAGPNVNAAFDTFLVDFDAAFFLVGVVCSLSSSLLVHLASFLLPYRPSQYCQGVSAKVSSGQVSVTRHL